MGNVQAKESRSGGRRSSSSAGGDGGGRSTQPSGRSGEDRSERSSSHRQSGSDSKSKNKSKSKSRTSGGGDDGRLAWDPNEVVDGGFLVPQGVYTGPQDFKHRIVRQLIIERRLAPFYKGIPDYDERWTDRQLLAAVRGLPIPPAGDKPGPGPGTTGTTGAVSAADKGKDKESPSVDGVVNGTAGSSAGTGVGAAVSGESETGPKLASSLPDRDLYGVQSGSDFVAPSPVPPSTSPRFEDDADGSSKTEMDSVVTGSSDTGVSSEIEREGASGASGSGTATGGGSAGAGSAANSLLAPLATAERIRRSSDSGLRHKASDGSVPGSSAASVALELASGATTTTNANTPTATTDQDSADSDLFRIKADALHVEHAHTASAAAAAAAATRSRSHTTSRYGPARPQDTANGIPTNGPPPPPLEVLLYRGAQECPICFLYYPNYLNETRCCKQSICTECFVQIKRADPHPPYNSGTSDAARAGPQSTSGTATETLVSEPAACPYCQMTDFGVIYRQSPFRSGIPVPSGRSFGRSLFSSSSSASISTQKGLSHSNPPVITTDHIRPDWSIKLTAARHHLARRSAAANALHASAFLAHNPDVAGTSSSSRRSSRSSSATSLLSFKKDKIKAKANRLRGMSSSKLGPNTGSTSASGSGSGAAGSSSASAAAGAAAAAGTSTTRSSSSTDSRPPSRSPAPRASDSSSSQSASVASPSAAADARRNDQIVINEVIRLSLADQPSSDHKHTATSSSTTLRT